MKRCSIVGCARSYEAKGLCEAHYAARRRKLKGQRGRPPKPSPYAGPPYVSLAYGFDKNGNRRVSVGASAHSPSLLAVQTHGYLREEL